MKRFKIKNTFLIIFLLNILSFIMDFIVYKSIDTSTDKGLIVFMCYGVSIICISIIPILSHYKKLSAGILGIVISLLEIVLGTIYIKILGVCLLINSIIYIIKTKDA